ncbi:MAG: xanthine dehydrogenase family protein molybdopterin-binding subunit [Acidimicrobiaceae bacterium]|nr:xanthine dehydrogenase family protein molybdopterin-binding subunit [Acidimicrobiaceae bacterium]
MATSILGTSVLRVEDPDLLTGKGTFIDNQKGFAHALFLRSPYAHARIISIDTSDAEKMPGIIAIFTAKDLPIPPHHAFFPLNDACKRPPLATEKVRFVGDAVAVVIAASKAEGIDATEAIYVDYEQLPAVVDPEKALEPGAPVQFEELGSNLAAGSREENPENALEDAEVIIRGRFINQRVAVVPMEGNAISVEPTPTGDRDMTINVSTQMPHNFAKAISKILDLDPDRIRVIAPHVGGAFGGKAGVTAEHSVVIAAALKLNIPVKWSETRSENMTALPHGRGQIQYVEMGFTKDGKITGLRCRMVGDSGAYAGFGGGLVMGSTKLMSQGVYEIPKIAYDVAVALTNTTPVGAFRGAGRPEAAAFLERIMDIAADELAIDPVQLRRKNLIPSSKFPFRTLPGALYDSGDYESTLDKALELADYQGLRAEQASRLASGSTKLLGIGISTYVEVTAGGGPSEFSAVQIFPDGTAAIKVGTSSHGQGHATSFSMIVSDRFGIPIEKIRFIQSDTSLVPTGGGTGGSRSLQIGGSAVATAAESLFEKSRQLAANYLEASDSDIVISDGGLAVAGVPSSKVSWEDLAAYSESQGDPLAVSLDFVQKGATFPFGSHVSVVEVDIETGKVTPIRHIAVDDCGRIINPLIVHGQQHGGIAQGIAQVLWEQFVYDDYGNPLTSTLAEYGMPSAAELPSFEVSNTETPTNLNPLGAKGIGESGTIGSMPAVHNAVIDAISHFGITHIDMPLTSEKVWQAIDSAVNGRPLTVWVEPPEFFNSLPFREAVTSPAAADVDI